MTTSGLSLQLKPFYLKNSRK